ncbi:hypothetical protein JG687_00006544 [Phytophthora cactorum]|uniref:C3HC-type domain-containing protein n=1 Tax=Phytophthora cactorum TaxID=29920 RepID=A0A8T1UI08_9STRA|nr:hypothetical protein JG687_00006544 [Phytophthora cactorum]
MTALGSQMEELLASWDDATAPIDARVREDPLMFASASEIVASSRVKRLAGPSTVLCRPWEHADFLSRVSSFSIASWFAKPDVISAFECARHGWRNSGPDQLHCNCCKQFLCFKIDDKLSEAGALKVAKKFAEQLVAGHTQLCPWQGNPSPEAFTTLPIATKRQVYEGFMDRLEELVARMREDDEFHDQMRAIKVVDAVLATILNEAGGTEDSAASLDTATFALKLSVRIPQLKDTPISSEALVSAAFLIVCGWQFDEKDVEMLCKENDEKEIEPPAKRLKTDTARAVDLLSQHRHFCPWVAGRKSTGVDDYGEIDPKLWEFVKLPGWKQYAQCMSFLGNPEDRAIVAVASSDCQETRRSNAEKAKLKTENEIYAAKLPRLQAELLEETSQVDETQAQSVQTQLILTQLKARSHVLQTRNHSLETQNNKLTQQLREYQQQLKRKTAALQQQTEKANTLEVDMNELKTTHTQEKLDWKNRLTTALQRFEYDKIKLETQFKAAERKEYRDVKDRAEKAVKKRRTAEATTAKLEEQLKQRKHELSSANDTVQRRTNEVRTLEALLRKAHRTEATLHNDLAVCKTKLRSLQDEKKRSMARPVSVLPRRQRLHHQVPIEMLLHLTDSIDDDEEEDNQDKQDAKEYLQWTEALCMAMEYQVKNKSDGVEEPQQLLVREARQVPPTPTSPTAATAVKAIAPPEADIAEESALKPVPADIAAVQRQQLLLRQRKEPKSYILPLKAEEVEDAWLMSRRSSRLNLDTCDFEDVKSALMKVNVYVAAEGGATRRICWYMGTSDAQVEKVIRIQLRLPRDTEFLLRDTDGDVVPVCSTLPNGQHYKLVVQEEDGYTMSSANTGITSIIRPIASVNDENDFETVGMSPPSPKRTRLDTEEDATTTPPPPSPLVDPVPVITPPTRRDSTPPRPVATIIAQFVDTFTRPIANEDNMNFIPNAGPFALYDLYCKVVRDKKFHPKREDVFYKMTSLHCKVDRQRVNRYYQCPVENGEGTMVVQCKPRGKGVLLRRYRKVRAAEELEDMVKAAPFISWLGLDPNEVVTLYTRFVDGFVPITKRNFRVEYGNEGQRREEDQVPVLGV